jgi:hypothetical protein
MANAAIPYTPGSSFGGRSDALGAWSNAAAGFMPKGPGWLDQAVSAGIAGAGRRREALINAAATTTIGGVDAAARTASAGLSGFAQLAGEGTRATSGIFTAKMEADLLGKKLDSTTRFSGQRLVGAALVGGGGLLEAFRKPSPLPQRETVKEPVFTLFGDSKTS